MLTMEKNEYFLKINDLTGAVLALGMVEQRGYANSSATPCHRADYGENCVF